MSFSNFGIAVSGLLASQAAIDLTGQNIANAGTEGYSRQVLYTEANDSKLNRYNANKRVSLVAGVDVQGVERIRNSFLDGQFRNQNSITGYANAYAEFIVGMNDVTGEPSEFGVAAKLNDFFEAASDLATNPEDTAAKTVFVNAANALTETFVQVDGGLSNLRESITKNSTGRLDITVDNVNSMLDRIAELNVEINTTEATGNQSNRLQDERDLLLDKISQFMDAKIEKKPNGGYEISVTGSSQEAKVTGTNAFSSYDTAIAPAITGGSANNTLTLSVNNGNGSATGPFTVNLDDNSSIRDVVDKINLSFKSAGGRGNIASLDDANRLVLQTNLVEDAKNTASSEIDITGGTALASLGLAVSTTNGSDPQKVILLNELSVKAHLEYDNGTNNLGTNPGKINIVQNNNLKTPLGSMDRFGGELGALLDLSNMDIPEFRSELNDLAMDLKDAVNSLLELGTTANGSPGAALFTGNSISDFGINPSLISNPNLLAPGENGAISDNTIATAITDLFFGTTTSLGANETEQKLYLKSSDASAGTISGLPIIPGESLTINVQGIIDDNGSPVNAGTNGFAGGSLVQIEFLDASGAVIGAPVNFPPSAGAPEDTVQYTGTAPIGAAFLRVKMNNTSFNDNNLTNNTGHFGVTVSKGTSTGNSVTSNFTDAYANFTGEFGARANFANARSDNANLLKDQLTGNRESVSGVSLEEEAANLLLYQNAFQANARVLSVMDQIIQEIINLI